MLYGFSEKAKFYGINLLSELDAPGEFYLDRRANSSSFGTLFFWPPADLALNEVIRAYVLCLIAWAGAQILDSG